MKHIQILNAQREGELEKEPVGIDSVLVSKFDLPPTGPPPDVDAVLGMLSQKVSQVQQRPGFDLVRMGNVDDREHLGCYIHVKRD